MGIISVLVMTFLGVVFLFPDYTHPTSADMNYTVVVFGGVMLLSLIWYYFPKYGGVHWFTGPVSNFAAGDGSSDASAMSLNEEKKNAQTDAVEATGEIR